MLHPICQQIWKTQQWPDDWKRSVFTPVLKKGTAKECSNFQTIALTSHGSNVCSTPFKLGFSSTWIENFQMYKFFGVLKKQRNQRSSCQHLLDHRESHGIPEKKNSYFIDYVKAFDCVEVLATQSCTTLWDPMDCSHPPLPTLLSPWDSPGKNTLTVWITMNCGGFLKKWECQTILTASWETCMQVKKQQLESYMEQLTGSK